MEELRCPNKFHGTIDGHILEVSCGSRFCGKAKGVVVLHRFDLRTGDLVETKFFRETVPERKEDGTR